MGYELAEGEHKDELHFPFIYKTVAGDKAYVQYVVGRKK